EVIYAHLAKGRRVYVDADDTIETLELKDGYEKDRDGQNVREARPRTAVEQGLAAWRRQVERGRVDDHEDDAEPAREENVDVDDGEEGDNVDDHEDNAVEFEEDDVNVDDHEDNAVEFEEDDVDDDDHEYDNAPLLPPGVRCDVSSVDDDNGLPPGLMPEMPLEEDNSSEEGSVDGSIGVDLDVLRERFGVSRSLRFGRFLETLPPVDSVVL
ncbi:hypothetical protein FOL46_004546, partial [Perkinsus olseni]